jgi:hypothetical protein
MHDNHNDSGGGGHHGDGGTDTHGGSVNGDICCRDTIIVINGQSIDLSREPLKVEFCGFTFNVSYSLAKERSVGENHVEQYQDYKIVITGAMKGDPQIGRPPGRLYINGKHIEYNYNPTSGRIDNHGIFSVHYSLLDFAHAFINANPTLNDMGHHHA